MDAGISDRPGGARDSLSTCKALDARQTLDALRARGSCRPCIWDGETGQNEDAVVGPDRVADARIGRLQGIDLECAVGTGTVSCTEFEMDAAAIAT